MCVCAASEVDDAVSTDDRVMTYGSGVDDVPVADAESIET